MREASGGAVLLLPLEHGGDQQRGIAGSSSVKKHVIVDSGKEMVLPSGVYDMPSEVYADLCHEVGSVVRWR
jgi:hypothetical protein